MHRFLAWRGLETGEILCHTHQVVEFLFFRHGETDWNLKRIFQGHSDIPLNSTGLSQAQNLADKIKHWKPDVLLSSDLARALQTGLACNQHWNAPVVQSPLLREMNMGKAEGLHRDEVKELVGPGFEKWVSHNPEDESFRFPEGESKEEARARILGFLEKFVKANPQYKRIAVSTHGGVLRRVTHALPGTPIEGVPIPNCVTYRVNWYHDQWHFVPVRERASVVVNHNDSILSFHAIDPHSEQEYHFLPGGLIEPNENAIECVEREALEETGFLVRADSTTLKIREYDFIWNNKHVWCRTHFFKGELVNPYDAPAAVNDAEYNKGVVWIEKDKSSSVFSYHPSIEEVTMELAFQLK